MTLEDTIKEIVKEAIKDNLTITIRATTTEDEVEVAIDWNGEEIDCDSCWHVHYD